MPMKLHYNYKDVFRAARLGFSAKKIWVQFLGLLIGTAVYSIFTYLGLILSGYTIKEVWTKFHYIPIPFEESFTVYGWIFLGIGLFLFVVINLIFGVAVSKITYEQLKGDDFYEVKKALSFAFKEGRAVYLAPIVLIILVAIILLGGVIIGLLGKIPWFGELVLLLLSIPSLFACAFIVYLFFAFVVAMYLSAAIVATTASDTFDTLFEVFSTLNDQNWRFIGYEALLYGVKFIAFSIFAWAIGRTLWIIHTVLGASWLMGAKYQAIEKGALHYFTYSSSLYFLDPYLSFLKLSAILEVPPDMPTMPLPSAILAFIFGILFYFVVFTVLSFWGAMHWAGNTLIFVTLEKKKDDIDLLEITEEEELTGGGVTAPTEQIEEEKAAGEETKGDAEGEKEEGEKEGEG